MSPSLELEEVTIGTGMSHFPRWTFMCLLKKGDKCGAIFIDREFRKWLAKKLGPTDFQKVGGRLPENDIGSHTIVEPEMRKIMKDFEGIKRSFAGSTPGMSYI